MLTRRLAIQAALAAAAGCAGSLPAHGQRADVVYVPTPHETVERMLRLADVGAKDFVIDLGSGDGRIPIAAARRGARALGIEIDPERIGEANANVQRAGVANRVTFRQEDLFKTPLTEATVITLYLLPELNARLAPRLLALSPDTRIVSHLFPMGDWKPDATDAEGGMIYLWIVPPRVTGRWQVHHGNGPFTVDFTQRYQEVGGTARFAGGTTPIFNGGLQGNAIEFAVGIAGKPVQFRGMVDGNRMQAAPAGLVSGVQTVAWSATRM